MNHKKCIVLNTCTYNKCITLSDNTVANKTN